MEENVFWKRSSDVIIIEDMILKMSVKNLGKMNGRRLDLGLIWNEKTHGGLDAECPI